jgi:hypothetical protein
LPLHNYPKDYVFAAQESLLLQLSVLDEQPVAPLVQRFYLRNILIATDRYFAMRDPRQEALGGALQELRDAAELFLHDSKAPISRIYLDELLEGVFVELASGNQG